LFLITAWLVFEPALLGEGDEVFTFGVSLLDQEVLLSGELGTGDDIVDAKRETEVG
jgi:hypothetical protein